MKKKEGENPGQRAGQVDKDREKASLHEEVKSKEDEVNFKNQEKLD